MQAGGSTTQTKHAAVCPSCGAVLPSTAHACPRCPDSLLQSVYREKAFRPSDRTDIFRFSDWLPCTTALDTPVGPAVFRSDALCDRVGLPNLVVAFNGYAPAVGARNPTASFKDFEALPTLLLLREHGVKSVILASAGNTARAFAYAGTILDFPVYLVVPEAMLYRVWTPIRPSSAIRLIVIQDSKDYAAAIRCAGLLSSRFGLAPEGGARNVARRDGMGTALLEYARTYQRLPRHYVQAVGSGTGAIAVWEAARRLLASGQFDGETPPVLHLAQNAPFTPIHDAWTHGRPIRPEHDVPTQLRRIDPIVADVLANRNPPYGLVGGVRDVLHASHGFTYSVSNAEIAAAQEVFCSSVGIAIGPEAGAALAALRQAAACRRVDTDDRILLHVTGSGDQLARQDYTLYSVEPWLRLSAEQVTESGVGRLKSAFRTA